MKNKENITVVVFCWNRYFTYKVMHYTFLTYTHDDYDRD